LHNTSFFQSLPGRGSISFNFLGFDPHISNAWDFLYASAISGWNSLTFFFTGLDSNETAHFHFHNGIQTMRIVAMPEPSSLLLLGLGFGGLALCRRLKGL
jgi:PEP-CTERM motif-containing protein